jgi:Mlc titration factor MtfA (ptsG expression regulator)
MPNGNADSDFQSNIEEYIAGTDPTNPASFFAVTSGQGSGFIVQWPSVSARTYQVLWAQSLTNGFQQQGPMIDYPQNSYTDTVHNAEVHGFYKVRVQLK